QSSAVTYVANRAVSDIALEKHI
ncbi:hypothetical protein CVE32_23905, partial [Pseudomonas syringae pv. actinidiae]|nr:hypothetical protein [Pseudomonas syringae pv. actinidiae]NAT48074.1 hypothetical protein [Pseudomonas syringae pv. actinidiae]